jgi:general secretion pathway protein I
MKSSGSKRGNKTSSQGRAAVGGLVVLWKQSVRRRRWSQRCALSLLEVILAIAILGGAMAAVGVCVRVGTQAASDARELTVAQLHCESKLAELVSGWAPLTPVQGAPLELAPDWLYSVDVQQSGQNGLLQVTVTVQRDPQYSARPVSATLVRWLIDPSLASQLQSQASGSSSASSNTQSSSSNSASGSSTGGTGNG